MTLTVGGGFAGGWGGETRLILMMVDHVKKWKISNKEARFLMEMLDDLARK